jgi:phage shock protein C
MSNSALPDPSPAEPAGQSPETGFSTSSPAAARERRQLRRSKHDRVIGGVCGGLGRYVDVDPVLFRIAFLALLIPGGAGLLIYILSWIVIPEFKSEEDEQRDGIRRPLDRRMAGTVVGGFLIIVGSLILIERLIDWFDPRIIGGTALVLIGALIVWRGLRRGDST